MPRRPPPGLALAVCALGCAASATTSVAPSDAATPVDAAIPIDAPTPGNVTLRVGLGPLVPPEYRAGVRVQALSGAGARDVRTDGAGYARFTLDPSDVVALTAAEAGHAAVTLAGVHPGFNGEVLLPALGAPRPTTVREISIGVAIHGRSAARSAVLIDGVLGTTVARDDALTLTAVTWPGAPAARLVALELDDASAFVNGWISPPIDLNAPLATANVDLPATPAQPAAMVLRVELPVVGLVTAPHFGAVLAESVARYKYTDAGAGLVPVGRSHLRAPGDPSFLQWEVEAFEGELAPEVIAATFSVTGDMALTASVTTRPSFRGVVPAFSPVYALHSDQDGAITIMAEGWSHPAFRVMADDGVVVWEGYLISAPPSVVWGVPTLPAGLTLATLNPAHPGARVQSCVVQDLPLSPDGWVSPAPSMALRHLLTVCEARGATLADR